MANARIQVPDLNTEQLRPVAFSGDTFVQPARPVQDNTADQFVHALGFFNQNLTRMAANQAADQQKRDAEAAQDQMNAIHMASPEGRAEIARTGKLPDGTPLKDAQVRKMAGAVGGSPFEDSVREWATSRDLTGVDVEAEIRKMAAPTIADINGDKFILGGFLPSVDRAIASTLDYQANQTLAARKQSEEGITYQYLSKQVDGWSKAGASPDDMRRGVQDLYSTVAAGHSALVTPELLDQYRVQKAQVLVDTDPAAAKALLKQEILGPDGKPRLGLAASPQYAGTVANILDRGVRVAAKQEVDQRFAERRHDNYRRILQDHDYSALQDLEVNGEKLTAGEQKVQLLADMNERMDAAVKAGTLTVAQKREEVARYTSRLGIDDPFVTGELEGIERRYSTLDAVRDPDTLKDLEERLKAYTAYRSTNRGSLDRQLSDKSKGFYEAADLYKRYVDASTEGALQFAHRVTSSDAPDAASLSKFGATIDSKIRTKMDRWGPNNGSLAFSNVYVGRIKKVATLFMQNGMNPETAVDAASDRVLAETINYDGDPLLGLEKMGLPNDYPALLKKMTEDYQVMDARGKAFKGAASFAHYDGGIIGMIDRDTGSLLEDQDGHMIVFNVQHLRDLSNAADKAKRDKAVREAAEENRRNQEARRDSAKQGIREFLSGPDPDEGKPVEPARGISRAALPKAPKDTTAPKPRRIIKPAADPNEPTWTDPASINKGVR